MCVVLAVSKQVHTPLVWSHISLNLHDLVASHSASLLLILIAHGTQLLIVYAGHLIYLVQCIGFLVCNLMPGLNSEL